MPWTPEDAKKFTKNADSEKKQRQWAAVANGMLEQHGDEAKAIAAANASVADALWLGDKFLLANDKLKIPIYGPDGILRLVYEEEEDDDDDDELDDAVRDSVRRRVSMVDAIALDVGAKLRETDDGYIAAMPRVARTGIQIYGGDECGRPDMAQVRVYRPEAQVFAKNALHSFAHKPVTIDHPNVPMTADNWKQFAVGHTGDEILRDGGTVRIPMVLMDASAVRAFKDGKKQLSVGYTCDLDWTAGKTAAGEQYDAVQTHIRANHLAVVAAARGGPQLTIGDDHEGDQTMSTLRTVVVDGIECQMTDVAASIVNKTISALNDQIKKMKDADDDDEEEQKKKDKDTDDAMKALDAAVKAKDAEIVTLKQQLKDVELTPEKLDALVKDRQIAIEKGCAVLGVDKLKVDGKSVAEIRKQVVDAKLGDLAKGWDANQIAASFNTIVADVRLPDGSSGPRDGFRDAVRAFGGRHIDSYTDQRPKAYADYDKEQANAWRNPAKTA